jgi:hypothetical protein
MMFSFQNLGRWLLVGFFLLPKAAVAEFLEQPSVRWSKSLQGNFRKGNAIVSSDDGSQLFVTSSDGTLHFVKTDSPDESIFFDPPAAAGASQATICRSSAAVVKDYIVYAVVDSGRRSRILAVNLNATLRWSLDVEGVIAGAPLIGNSGYIYFARNVLWEQGSRGFLSVVSVNDDIPEIIASISAETEAPFSPPSISSLGTPQTPNGGDDFVVVAEAWENGFAEEGSVYILAQSDQFEALEGRGSESYVLRLASSFPFAVVVPPTLSKSGPRVWVAGQSSIVAGWTDDREFGRVLDGRREDIDPTWTTRVRPNLDFNQREYASRYICVHFC